MHPIALLQSTALYVLPFLAVLTLVVTVHELGHFLMAKAFGTAIDRFSIGFGKAIASWTDRSGVEWRIGWVPLGGYVRFRGDAEASSSVPDQDDLEDLRGQITRVEGPQAVSDYFHFKPLWQRALVVAAGPAANFLLAIVLFAFLFMSFGTTTLKPRVGAVVAGSVAAKAGFVAGDLIAAVDGNKVEGFTDLLQYVQLRANQPIRFDIVRAGAPVSLVATPEMKLVTDPLMGSHRSGVLGLESSRDRADLVHRRYGPVAAIGKGVHETATIINGTLTYVGRIFRGLESGDKLSGPLGIARMSGALTKASTDGAPTFGAMLLGGGGALLTMAASLSVALGFTNLLPVPVLDGGHLLFYAYEAAARRPVGARVQAAGYRVGLALLLGLMLFATWNDLQQLSLFKMIGGLFS